MLNQPASSRCAGYAGKVIRLVRVGLPRLVLHGVDDTIVLGVWITGIRRRVGSTAQGHKPGSNPLRSTGVGGREVGKQGHGATLKQSSPHLDDRAPRLWTTGVGVDNSEFS